MSCLRRFCADMLSWSSHPLPDNVVCFMLQDEYLGHISGLRRLLSKGQQVAVQHMHSTLSGLAAEIAKAKSTIDVFHQAASLSSSKDSQASMIRECAAVSDQLTALTADEHDLKAQVEQVTEKHSSHFCQQLLDDLCNTG